MGLGRVMEGQRASESALGLHLAVVCAEDFPLVPSGAKALETGADFARVFADLYTTACAKWPRGNVSPAFYVQGVARSPTLMLSGALDPVTPPRHARQIEPALGPLAQHVLVPNAGHGVMTLGCMRDVVTRFIDAADKDALPVDAACVKQLPMPEPYVPYASARSAP
jgi:fermentation-respiration switch protein FrsA (DUF1100 family)